MKRLLLVLLAVLLTACGVPEDGAPRALDPSDAPAVFAPEVVPPPQGDLEVELFYVRDDALVPVARAVPTPGSPKQVLDLLFTGLTEPERSTGLRSAIPVGVSFDGVEVEEGVAAVTLEGLNEQVQVLAFAQIVATLDARTDVVGVRFRSDGSDVQVPRGDGSLTSEPVGASAYATLLGVAETSSAVPPTPATG